jgi:mannitol 2-dehydrogenase
MACRSGVQNFLGASSAMTIKLSLSNLPNIARHIPVPAYDRAALSAGILHIGVGNFHRAHQAVYLDDLFNIGTDLDWALVGSSVREGDVAMQQDLLSQDLLTTVVAQEADRASARVTGSMVEFIEPANTATILERLCDPAIRIVSLTITEGGYYIDPASQAFDATHPDIVADAAAPAAPKSAFGLILAALVHRRRRAIAPFTVMSCDNLPGNGHVAESAVAGLADLIDPDLALWVREHVSFPNSMVDRITPATTARERSLLEQMCGIADARPVFCEEFRQWVLEDRFPAGRPALEKVGVQFVDDVMPFELMKIRILNGGHAAIAYPAALLDIQFAHDAMAEPLIGEFLARLLDREVIPIVPPVPGTDLGAYKLTIERRFANPKIGDTIRRLCLDGSNRQPKFILPSIRDRVRQGLAIDGLALVTAFWCRYCYGETESGAAIAPNDPSWEELQARAKRARHAPREWLDMSNIFGDLAGNPAYVAAFSAALERVWREGTRSALRNYLAGGA